MKERIIKITLYFASASALLFVGYSAGLSVQHQREVRFASDCRLYQYVALHKELSLGSYESARRKIESEIIDGVRGTHYQTEAEDFPRLLSAGAFDQFSIDWRDKAFALAVGFHRAQPEVVFPPDLRQELDSFVPANEQVRIATSFYAQDKPRQ